MKTRPGWRPSLLRPFTVLLSSMELNVWRSMPVRSTNRCVAGWWATGPRARSASAALLKLRRRFVRVKGVEGGGVVG